MPVSARDAAVSAIHNHIFLGSPDSCFFMNLDGGRVSGWPWVREMRLERGARWNREIEPPGTCRIVTRQWITHLTAEAALSRCCKAEEITALLDTRVRVVSTT